MLPFLPYTKILEPKFYSLEQRMQNYEEELAKKKSESIAKQQNLFDEYHRKKNIITNN